MKFPNMSTMIAYQYFVSSNIDLTNSIEKLKTHMKLLKVESTNVHPFISSCTHHTVNNIDWGFIESLAIDGTKQDD